MLGVKFIISHIQIKNADHSLFCLVIQISNIFVGKLLGKIPLEKKMKWKNNLILEGGWIYLRIMPRNEYCY
jgi:hypothetical protein